MLQYSDYHYKPPSRTSAFRTKVVLVSILLLVLSIGGLWLRTGPLTELHGTWKNTERYVMFTSDAEGVVDIRSRDCQGYPFHQKGNATLNVAPTPGVLFFPERLERQSYRVLGWGRWLIIDDAGPIPPGIYTYASANTLPVIGICGLHG
jgi:hypothetical protein